MRVLIGLLLAGSTLTAGAQVSFIRDDYFPAELEFRELGAIRGETSSPAGGDVGFATDLLREAGMESYRRRTYASSAEGDLAVEVIVLKDGKGAYSLLTLLPGGALARRSPPGDIHRETGSGLAFAQSNVFVRLEGSAAMLRNRVAVSISNRIGAREGVPPLIARLPAPGLDPASVRYFLGRVAFARYGHAGLADALELPGDVELAEGRYRVGDGQGTLVLASFPTPQLAEEHYDRLFAAGRLTAGATELFLRRSGPILGVLDGTLGAVDADGLLAGVRFTYAVQWIFDRRNHAPRSVFGVPVVILGTVVRSIFFTVLLCCVSLAVGVGVALVRVGLRVWAPGNYLDRPERNDLIRLKLDEN